MSSKEKTIIMTRFGPVLKRNPGEPAPLICEGKCSMDGNKMTMHLFFEHRMMHGVMEPSWMKPTFHDIYQCSICGTKRVWG